MNIRLQHRRTVVTLTSVVMHLLVNIKSQITFCEIKKILKQKGYENAYPEEVAQISDESYLTYIDFEVWLHYSIGYDRGQNSVYDKGLIE